MDHSLADYLGDNHDSGFETSKLHNEVTGNLTFNYD